MPRQPRLDAPGFLHHVIARGIERTEIFRDDRDRTTFVDALGELVSEAGARVYAWCLLSNHFHLVLETGEHPLAWIMRRLMTGHAVRFNRRHKRCGHLFQNRYKSIVVEEEVYFLQLVRYVALNPVRAAVARTPEELDGYPWNGHAVLVGTRAAPWQGVDAVLARFSSTKGEAIARYRAFVLDGWSQGRRDDLTGGGLVRSAGGAGEVLRRRSEEREAADERILGGGEFVEDVWRAAQEPPPARPHRPWEEILRETAEKFGLEENRILSDSRQRRISAARREFFVRSREEAGLTVTQLARLCKMNPSSVSRGIQQAAQPEGERRMEQRVEKQ